MGAGERKFFIKAKGPETDRTMVQTRRNRGGAKNTLSRLFFIFVGGALALSVVACGAKTEQEYLSEAQQALDQQNPVEAIVLYKEYLKKFADSPDVPQAKMSLVEAYFDNREFDICRELLDEILEANGGPATDEGIKAFRVKVASYAREGDPAGALAYAESNSEIFEAARPEIRSVFRFALAELYPQLGRKNDALEFYKEVLAGPLETPGDKLKHSTALDRTLQIMQATNDVPAAIVVMEGYIKAHPGAENVPELHVRTGRAYAELSSEAFSPEREELAAKAEEHFLASEAYFRNLIETTRKADEKTDGILKVAQLLHLRKKSAEGRDYYRKIVDNYPLSPSRPRAMLLLAMSHLLESDYETAAATFSQVIEAYPGTRDALEAQQGLQMIVRSRAQAQVEETIEGDASAGTKSAEPESSDPDAAETVPGEAKSTEPASTEADPTQ